MHFRSCGCEHCRRELRERSGIDLPSYEDRNFWGNWENPAWKEWIDMRFESGKRFFEKVMPQLPKDFPVTTCGSDSAAAGMNGKASDARTFMEGGVNYAHCEWSGNTPPYKHDPVTSNSPISRRLVSSSHHLAVARERGLRCFTTGYGFTEPTANIIWALNKALDQDCCFSTLKARLGLPQDILDSLPEEYDVVGRPYAFEAPVVEEKHLARRMGFPTANGRFPDIVKPKAGSYISRTVLPDGRRFFSVTNLGVRPTVGGSFFCSETHILDFSEDLRGGMLRVELLEFLRPEKRFDNIDRLRAAISADVAAAMLYAAKHS
jgi:hypothetical protein